MAKPTTAPAANPLEQLRDIHLPEAISWWPLAPGWWLLIISGGLFVGWLLRLFYRRHLTKLYRRQALQKLEQLRTTTDTQMPLRALVELLKQTANSAYLNLHSGSYNIEQFMGFLKYSCKKSVFDNLTLDMNKALYSNARPAITQNDELFNDAKIWIKQHVAEHKLEGDKGC